MVNPNALDSGWVHRLACICFLLQAVSHGLPVLQRVLESRLFHWHIVNTAALASQGPGGCGSVYINQLHDIVMKIEGDVYVECLMFKARGSWSLLDMSMMAFHPAHGCEGTF